MVALVTKPCQLCNATSTVEVTDDEMAALQKGLHIQNALPNRSEDFCELVISGTHPECWEQIFKDDADSWDHLFYDEG